ncbi:MAG: DNA translocase FtsK [Gemmatimonadota bacterium]|jgi:S-DNA-T family DNA segregation ATPase FtsK/SpoIIIE|nr:DNA translocase FtsK [Gemmatimonadota bacterium]MDP6802067.1 DNA translocase FtsK [Gemmatimonadota bacterium]MDP7032447.1 DNA translocase FtsK [Gemmatimonadota bacterium]
MGGKSRRRKRSGRPRLLAGLCLLVVALMLAVALVAYIQNGNWRVDSGELAREMGRINHFAASRAIALLGALGAWLLPLGAGAVGVRLLAGRSLPGVDGKFAAKVAGAVVLAATFIALPGESTEGVRGFLAGWVGTRTAWVLEEFFGRVGATILLVGASVVLVVVSGVRRIPGMEYLQRLGSVFATWTARVPSKSAGLWKSAALSVRSLFAQDSSKRLKARRGTITTPPEESGVCGGAVAGSEEEPGPGEREIPVVRPAPAKDPGSGPDLPTTDEQREGAPVEVLPSRGEPTPPRPAPAAESDRSADSELQSLAGSVITPEGMAPYAPPPLHFLAEDEENAEVGPDAGVFRERAGVLETTLRDFGIKGKVTQVFPGPVITRYEVEPAPGQKVSAIAGLSDDLALAMRASQIRIQAPIPGKGAVGIEIPNDVPVTVRLRPLLESKEFTESRSKLTIALGRTISGDPYCVPLDAMPHVLVAGATGSGKSVCINTIIMSIIYQAGPERVRFVMVDPKMLELQTYVGLPHLIPPVVTQAKEAVKILKWAVGEMQARYRMLAHVGVRGIGDYNSRQEQEGAPTLPFLVIVVDELADLMLSNVKGDIETSIARLAQMGRAVGIHLVLATQRPSVDVITGVIKANFPSRVAFQVPTGTDSRTILDGVGAERLLGKGDMLYLGVGMPDAVRVHGSFVSTEEAVDVVEWLKTHSPSVEEDAVEESPIAGGDDLFPMEREDDLFEEAARILVAHQQGSISLLQRRLKVGYARAARLVDMMEEAGIVGPFTGSKAREILVPTVEDLDKLLSARSQGSPGGVAGS